jgi:hypothetical protein
MILYSGGYSLQLNGWNLNVRGVVNYPALLHPLSSNSIFHKLTENV